MLRQFGVPRPIAPMRPMLGQSNADAPFIEMKPASTARDIGLAFLQAASMTQPYYKLLPPAFDVMRPTGARKERTFWPNLSSDEGSYSGRDERRRERQEKSHQRRRTVSAPAAKHHNPSRGRRRQVHPNSISSEDASGTLRSPTSNDTYSDRDERAKDRRGQSKKSNRRDRPRRRSHSISEHDRRREKASVVYSPLFPPQPPPLPNGIVYFRDIPPNVPIAQFATQPTYDPSKVSPGAHQQTLTAPNIPYPAHKLPYPALPSSTRQPYRGHTVFQPNLPLSHAQVGSRACPYIRGQLAEGAWGQPGGAAQVEADAEVAAPPAGSALMKTDMGARPEKAASLMDAGPPLPGTSPSDGQGTRISGNASRQPRQVDHDDMGQEEPDRSLSVDDARRMAIINSGRAVQLWRNKLDEYEQEPAIEATWNFANRAWHTGVLHADHTNTRLGHLLLTYKHRGDDETTSFVIDYKKGTMTTGVKDDVKAIRAACKHGMHLEEFIQRGVPALIRFEWVQANAGAGGRAERNITDLLLLGRIKRNKPYIARHHYRKKSLMILDSGEEPDASKGAKKAPRWKWPLKEAPDFARWASKAEKLEVAFRPSAPSEIYAINDCNC